MRRPCNKKVCCGMSQTATNLGELSIKLQLLDPSRTYTTQTWAFNRNPVVRIGRADSNDIVLPLPIVSRVHAELTWCDDHWQIVSLGRHGVLVEGKQIERAEIEDGTVFQLGQTGPALRLIVAGERKEEQSETISANFTALKAVDEAEKARQVAEITDSTYFRKIQRVAKQLRGEKEAGGG